MRPSERNAFIDEFYAKFEKNKINSGYKRFSEKALTKILHETLSEMNYTTEGATVKVMGKGSRNRYWVFDILKQVKVI